MPLQKTLHDGPPHDVRLKHHDGFRHGASLPLVAAKGRAALPASTGRPLYGQVNCFRKAHQVKAYRFSHFKGIPNGLCLTSLGE
jgi:hypothetical protein